MEDNVGQYFIHNGAVKNASEPVYADSSSGRSAYEVIRIINGVPLFFEDHYERMKGTFQAIGKPLDMTQVQLADSIKRLLSANDTKKCNVKVVVSDSDGIQQQVAYLSRSYYPSEEEADEGVRTGLIRIERKNPNAKILNKSYKDAVNEKMSEGGFFEVLLVNDQWNITEGSKSNAFFVKDGSIFTAPGDTVLKGITRKYVFEACSNAGFKVKEQFVNIEELNKIDGAFLSGTSIKVLPIRSIDGMGLDPSANPVISAVRREYDKLLEKYIESNVNIW
ncbi:MAG TPA: aminotransferase class IV [Clostridia bacterium]|nr:aminotransferase class IV [Clostridia bacterium]